MKIRFQADADLNGDILTGVLRRVPEIDFQTADDAGLRGLSDSNVLALARSQGRVLVTHDQRTMPSHFGSLIAEESSPGVLVISQNLEVSVAIEELILIWAASESEEYVNLIRTLPL